MRARDNSPRAAIFGTGQLAGDIWHACRGSGIPVVAAISRNPARIGADFGEAVSGRPVGLPVDRDLRAARARGSIDVLLYAGLGGDIMLRLCEECVALGMDFITTSGFFVPESHPDRDLVARLGRTAVRTGAHILGTGMNPGFIADILPALIATAMPSPVRIDIRRISDVTSWGYLAMREEANIGKAPDTGLSTVVISHMTESVHLLAAAVGLKLDGTGMRSTPVLSKTAQRLSGIDIAPGHIVGFEHRVSGLIDGAEPIVFEWVGLPGSEAARAAAHSPPKIRISGPDGMVAECDVVMPRNPYPGTAARMVKSIAPLRAAPPGFRRADELALAQGAWDLTAWSDFSADESI